jgi:hypothetical protein
VLIARSRERKWITGKGILRISLEGEEGEEAETPERGTGEKWRRSFSPSSFGPNGQGHLEEIAGED